MNSGQGVCKRIIDNLYFTLLTSSGDFATLVTFTIVYRDRLQ